MINDYVCITCGSHFQSNARNKHAQYCLECRRRRHIDLQIAYYYRRKGEAFHCLDCGKGVSGKGRRCIKCQAQNRRNNESRALGANRGFYHKGYIKIKVNGKWMLEHRYIWEQTHNQKLPLNWQVHHLDGDKANNAPSNLYACSISSHHSLPFIKVLQDRICGLQKELKILKSSKFNHLL